jgi:hypothetical protein
VLRQRENAIEYYSPWEEFFLAFSIRRTTQFLIKSKNHGD